MASPFYCPTRGKITYLTEEAAGVAALAATEEWSVEYEPYLCICKRWHTRGVAKNRVTEARMAEREAERVANAGPPPRPFEEWEDDWVRSEMTAAIIAEFIPRSAAAVRQRRRKLRELASTTEHSPAVTLGE